MDKSGLFIEEKLTERDDSSPDAFEDRDTARQEDHKSDDKYPIFLYYSENRIGKENNHNNRNVRLIRNRKMVQKLSV